MADTPQETLDLAHLDDAAFEKLYRDKIEPLLLAREAERRTDVSYFWWRLIPGLTALAVVVAIAALREWYQAAFIGGLIGSVAIAMFAFQPLSLLREQVKKRMLDTIAGTIGCAYTESGFAPIAYARLQTLGLVPHCDRQSFEDWFAGQRFKCGFDLYEAHLEEKHEGKNGPYWVIVFRGQLLRVSFPKKFLGVTVVRRDSGLFNFFHHFGSSLQRVGLEDPKFEREFEVYASDQVEARELIHPVFMERLLTLEKAYDGKRMRCAFQDGDLLLAVEGRDRFEVGSMFRPLADPKRVRTVVDDIAEILRLVDAMLTVERAPLIALGNKDVPVEGG